MISSFTLRDLTLNGYAYVITHTTEFGNVSRIDITDTVRCYSGSMMWVEERVINCDSDEGVRRFIMERN